MLSNSLQYRGVIFAFLLLPPKLLTRDAASQLHGRICDALKLDDLTFRYSTGDVRSESRSFKMQVDRTEGRGGYQVVLENLGPESPMRLLFQYEWPPSLPHVAERMDLTWGALATELQCTPAVAEVRSRAQCAVRGQDALKFVAEHMLAPQAWIAALGGLTFGSVTLEVAPAFHQTDSLENPRRELTIEVLREDPRSVYLELMSQWSQFPGNAIDLSRIRPIDRRPGEYVEETFRYLQEKLSGLEEVGRSK